MSREWFSPGALPPVPVRCPADAFDNAVRLHGIGFCCEWFGHAYDGEFAQETLRVLQERAKGAQP